jgi:isoleucyl-tRNA synthetase
LRYRTDREYWQKWFPADFITESFPGQFRNWFYSLIAMSTVLEEYLPARTILGFATLLDEQGQPMHKSSGNSIEFNEAADSAGADVMRWLYSRQKYSDDLLFGFGALGEVRRGVILPLWNVYAFFVTYANADRWYPNLESPGANGGSESHRSESRSENALDRWIHARMAETTNAVVEALDAFEVRPATLAIEAFVDDLSNWYVRRSRDRFWGGTMTPDKQAAYDTLHGVLTALSRLLAPFVPFLAEAMWQNLANSEFKMESASENARLSALRPRFSVHHQPYPTPRELSAEERALLNETRLARTVVNLGHSTRAQSKVKVRQPLARAMIVAGDEARVAIRSQYDIITDELNVKALEFVEREGDLVEYRVLPNLKKLGKKLGQDLPRVRAGLAQLDPAAVAMAIKANQPVAVDGLSLQPDEVLVQPVPREGLIVAGDGEIVVGLDTALTDDLIKEGLAREVVRRINDLRKAAGLGVSDRITTTFTATPRLAEAIEAFASYVRNETLSVDLRPGTADGHSASDEFDNQQLTITINKL